MELRRHPSEIEIDVLQAIRRHPDWAVTKIMHSCSLNYTQIMKSLKRLKEDGLVSKRENMITKSNGLRGRPATVYFITDEGRSVIESLEIMSRH